MPHLMLNFKAEREVKDLAGQLVPTGNETLAFTMIDTDQGKVIELSADAKNLRQVEREPKWGEMHTASQVLGREPGKNMTREEFERMESEKNAAAAKLSAAQADLVAKNKLVVKLQEEVNDLQTREIKPERRDLLAAALDGYIEELALTQQFVAYEEAKSLYRQLTGSSWADEGDDDEPDDEEGD